MSELNKNQRKILIFRPFRVGRHFLFKCESVYKLKLRTLEYLLTVKKDKFNSIKLEKAVEGVL